MKKIVILEVITVIIVILITVGCIFTSFSPPSLVYMRPGNNSLSVALNALLEWKFEPGVVEGLGDPPTIVKITLEFGLKDALKKIRDYYSSQGTYNPDLNYGQQYEWRLTAEDSNGETKAFKYSFTVEATPETDEELAITLDTTDISFLAGESEWWCPSLVTATIHGTNVSQFDILTYCSDADHAYELADIEFPSGESATDLTCDFNSETWMLPDENGNITIGNTPAPGTSIVFTIEAKTDSGTTAVKSYRVTGLNATATLNATQAENASIQRGNEIDLEKIEDNQIELTFNSDFTPDIFQVYSVNIQLIEAPVGPAATPSIVVEANDKSKSVKDHLYTLNNGPGVYVFKGTLQGTTTYGQYIAEIISDFATVNYRTDNTDPQVGFTLQEPLNGQATITFSATDTGYGFDPDEQSIVAVNGADVNWNTPAFDFPQGAKNYTYTVICSYTPGLFDGETLRATLTVKDIAGNSANSQAALYIDEVAPKILAEVTNPGTAIQTGQTKTFSYEITDGGEISDVNISFNNANNVITTSVRGSRTTQTADITLTGHETGTGTITVTATDAKDNVSTEDFAILVYSPLTVTIKNVATDNGNYFTSEYATVTFTATGSAFVQGFYRITVGGESTFSNINRMEDQEVIWRLPSVDATQFWATIVATDTYGAAYPAATQVWVDNRFGELNISANTRINAASFNSPALFATITATDFGTTTAIEITHVEGIDSASVTIGDMITPLLNQRNNLHTKMATASLQEPFGATTTYATVTFTATDSFGNSTNTDVVLGIDTFVPLIGISFNSSFYDIVISAADYYVDENLGGFVSNNSLEVEITHQSSFTDHLSLIYYPVSKPIFTEIEYDARPKETMDITIYATATVTDRFGNCASITDSATIQFSN